MNLWNNSLYMEELNIEAARQDIPWNLLNRKTVLITGASGMIGSYIVDLIMQRNQQYDNHITIYALSRNRKKLEGRFGQYKNSPYFVSVEMDINNPVSLKNIEMVDYIIHAASNTHPKEYATDPVGTIMTNVYGTCNLFEYMRHRNKKNHCRMIILSSVEIYGENRGDINKFNEEWMGYLNCNTLRAGYPESKRVSEALMQAYIMQYDLDAVCVRLSRIYGASLEDDDSKAMTQFLRNAMQKESIILKSEGKQLYSYSYIADAVRAILIVMLKGGRGETYNVSDDKSDVTLKEIVQYLAELSGVEVVFQLPDKKEALGYSTATKALLDSSKVKEELGWKAYYTIYDGIKKTLNMMRQKTESIEND